MTHRHLGRTGVEDGAPRVPKGAAAAVPQSMRFDLLGLQRAAGNAAVTYVLASRKSSALATPAALPVVQRRIGFEFEDRTWRPWKIDRGTRQVSPVPRKHVLHAGTNYRLEADDTPGPTHSNVEFVTVPFDETRAGVQALIAALTDIRTIVGRLGPHKGKPGPRDAGPPYPYTSPFDYLLKGTHQLSGSNDVSADQLALSRGSDRGQVKMQATMGLTLRDLPRAMATYGTVNEGDETPQEALNRQSARALQSGAMYGRILGQAPALGLQVLDRIIREAHLSAGERRALVNRESLLGAQGYLAVVMMYLKSLQIPDDNEGAKSRIMFLARNKFSDMFLMLDPAVRRLFSTNAVLFAQKVLAVSNENPLVPRIQGQLPDTALSVDRPLINYVRVPQMGPTPPRTLPAQQVLSPFSIGRWLLEVALGRDSLSSQAMAISLTNLGVNQPQATAAAGVVLESFGEYGTDTTGDEELALFENRGISSPDISIDEAAKIALNYLLHAALVASGQGGRAYPQAELP